MRTLITVVTLIMMLLSLMTISQPSYSQVTIKNRVLIIFAPGLNIDELIRMNATLTNVTGFNFTSIILNATRLEIDPSPPYDSLYHQYNLVTGSRSGFEQLYLNESSAGRPWLAVDHELMMELWDPNSTVFTNFDIIDPKKYDSATNPKFNLTGFNIPSTILAIKINGSVVWEPLNITINLTFSNGYYRVTLNGSSLDKPVRDIRFVNNVTDRFLINITGRVNNVEPGLYRLKIRLVEVNETHAKIFIPSVRDSERWLSNSLGIYDKPVYVNLEEMFSLSQHLGSAVTQWLLNETILFYKDLFTIAARKPQAGLVVYNYDLLTYSFISNNNEFRERAIQALGEIIIEAVRRDYNIVLYVPYRIEHKSDTTINGGLEMIVPGLFRVKDENSINTLVNLLLNGTINNLEILEFSNKKYVLISYRMIGINNVLVEQGGLLIYPSQKVVEKHVLSSENVIGYLLAFSRSYGLGISDVLKKMSSLNHELARANSMIAGLNQTINELNETISSLKKKIGDLEAEAQLLRNQVSDLNSTIDTYQRREREMKTFLVAGIASIIVLNVLLIAIGVRILKREK